MKKNSENSKRKQTEKTETEKRKRTTKTRNLTTEG